MFVDKSHLMVQIANKYLFSSVIVCVLFLGMPISMMGEPSHGELLRSDDPLLVDARKVDLSFVGPQKGSQQRAEELYLQYIAKHSDSPLVPYIYFHLGHMYSDQVDSKWPKKYGHVRNDKKAAVFFEYSVKHHPTDKISSLLVDAKVNVAASAPTPEECTKRYIEFYAWITSIKMEEVADRLWLSEDEKRRVKDPAYRAAMVKTFWESLQQMAEVAKGNMVAAANTPDKGKAIRLLDTINHELPNTPPAQLAQKVKVKIVATHPPLEVKSVRTQRLWFWITLVLLVICVVVLVGRRMIRKSAR